MHCVKCHLIRECNALGDRVRMTVNCGVSTECTEANNDIADLRFYFSSALPSPRLPYTYTLVYTNPDNPRKPSKSIDCRTRNTPKHHTATFSPCSGESQRQRPPRPAECSQQQSGRTSHRPSAQQHPQYQQPDGGSTMRKISGPVAQLPRLEFGGDGGELVEPHLRRRPHFPILTAICLRTHS